MDFKGFLIVKEKEDFNIKFKGFSLKKAKKDKDKE
jgi:hypothetical protein